MGWGTLKEVRDRSGDPTGGPGRVGGPSGMFEMGWEALIVVRDELGDPRKGPRRVGALLGRFGTGQGPPQMFGMGR